MAGDGMDATLVFYYLKRCGRRKEFAAGGRISSKYPKLVREPSEIARSQDAFVGTEVRFAGSSTKLVQIIILS